MKTNAVNTSASRMMIVFTKATAAPSPIASSTVKRPRRIKFAGEECLLANSTNMLTTAPTRGMKMTHEWARSRERQLSRRIRLATTVVAAIWRKRIELEFVTEEENTHTELSTGLLNIYRV
jgi:hypothetical protein